MANIYVYSDNTALAAELITFVKEAGQTAYAITLSEKAAESIKGFGAEEITILKGDNPIPENYSKAIADFLNNEKADLLLVGANPRGRDIAARVSAYLDCPMVSDVLSLSYENGLVETERMIYGGKVIQSEVMKGLSVVTVPLGTIDAVEGGISSIKSIDVVGDSRVSLLGATAIVKEGANLSVADKVVCVGLGMEKAEDMKMAQDLAAAIGGEIGCSRGIAEERCWLPVEQYIGISGAVVKPQLYLSMGLSGQIQHVVGIRDSKIIVAVDLNEKAPIFKAADYGIVGDMYEIIPLLTEALKNK